MGQAKNSKKKMDNQEPVKKDDEAKRLEREIEEKEDNRLEEYGQVILEDNQKQRKIHLITIIGEVEGCLLYTSLLFQSGYRTGIRISEYP